MKSTIRLFTASKINLQFSGGFILNLALTSLLICGVTLNCSNSALAIPSIISQAPESSEAPTSNLPTEISTKVLRDASKLSGVPIHTLKISQALSTTFSNSCVFSFGEVCTEQYNPVNGWKVNLKVRGQSWTYHVNKPGSQIVLDPKITASVSSNKLPKAIANKVLIDASKRSKVPIANLKVTKATTKKFSNVCEFNFGEACAEIYKPVAGWEVIVQVKEQSWTYHVSKPSGKIILDPKISQTPSKS
jgi:uncharacterized protein YcnI